MTPFYASRPGFASDLGFGSIFPQSNLLCVAIARAKKLVVSVGTKKAPAMAAGRQDTGKRCPPSRDLQSIPGQ